MILYKYKVKVKIEIPFNIVVNKISNNYSGDSGGVFLIQKKDCIKMYNLCLLSVDIDNYSNDKGSVLYSGEGSDARLIQNLTKFSEKEIEFDFYHEEKKIDKDKLFIYPAFISEGTESFSVINLAVKEINIENETKSIFYDEIEFMYVDSVKRIYIHNIIERESKVEKIDLEEVKEDDNKSDYDHDINFGNFDNEIDDYENLNFDSI